MVGDGAVVRCSYHFSYGGLPSIIDGSFFWVNSAPGAFSRTRIYIAYLAAFLSWC